MSSTPPEPPGPPRLPYYQRPRDGSPERPISAAEAPHWQYPEPERGHPVRTLLVVVAVLAVTGVGAGLLTWQLTKSSGPEVVANDFVEAALDADCDRVTELSTPRLQERLPGCGLFPDLPGGLPGIGHTVTMVEVTDATATAKVTLELLSAKATTELTLVEADGGWLVDQVGEPDFDPGMFDGFDPDSF